MSFGIAITTFDSNENSMRLYYAILEAESKGLDKIVHNFKGSTVDSSVKVGQIIFYKSDEIQQFANYWQVSGFDSDHHQGLKTIIELQRLDEHIVDTTGIKISEEERLGFINDLKDKGYEIGSFYVTNGSIIGRIKGFLVEEVLDSKLTHQNHFVNPNRERVMSDEFLIEVEYEGTASRRHYKLNGFCNTKKETYSEFIKDKHPIKWRTMEEIAQKMHMLIENGIDEDKILMIGNRAKSEEGVDEQYSLVGYGDNEHLKMVVKDNAKKVGHMQSIVLLDKRSISIEKEKIEEQLNGIRNRTNDVLTTLKYNIMDMSNKVREMTRLIDTIEIFSGVTEKIVHIKEGKNATDSKINIFQRKLFMDEEVGVWQDGGITFNEISEFDKWVGEHIDDLMKSEVGILMMSPRRDSMQRSRYDDQNDIFSKAMNAELNERVYIIVRNGENIYRIFTDKIKIGARFFPIESELTEIITEIQKNEAHIQEMLEKRDEIIGESQLLDSKDKLFHYVRNFLLIQGIVSRTNIFDFVPASFNIFDNDHKDEFVNYVYDDDKSKLLSDGVMPFNAWVMQINENLRRGKKIIFFATEYNTHDVDFKYRFKLDIDSYHRISPPDGIYTIKSEIIKDKQRKEILIDEREYLLNPKKYDKVWGSGAKVENGVRYVRCRDQSDEGIIETQKEEFYITFFQDNRYEKYYKQHIRFIIRPTDTFFICYENIEDSVLDYYLTNREARREYLKVLPLLGKFKDIKTTDNEIKAFYVDMLLSKISDIKLDKKSKLAYIEQAIDKWKYGNDVTVNSFSDLKRGSAEEIKSIKSMEIEIKRLIKKNHKVNVGTTIFSKDKIWFINTGGRFFYTKSLTKKEFIDVVSDSLLWNERQSKKFLGALCSIMSDEEFFNKYEEKMPESGVIIKYN